MSCLALPELPLSDQIDIELHRAAYLCALAEDVITVLASPVPPSAFALEPITHPGGANLLLSTVGEPPDLPPAPAVDGDLFQAAEHPAMTMERQITDHPPLLVCHPGHQPRMFEVRGDCMVRVLVECQLCGVRTGKLSSQEEAAAAWAKRQVQPIPAPDSAKAVA